MNIPLGLLLLGLTGVGPLIAWRRASVSNLKRQFAAPVTGGIVLGAALFALGMRDGYALISYTLAGFVATTGRLLPVRSLDRTRENVAPPEPQADLSDGDLDVRASSIAGRFAAAEVAVGLSIIVMLFRNTHSVDVNFLNRLKH